MHNIPMIPVESSNVAEIGYQGGILAVKFRSGGEYQYKDVPAEVFEQMQQPDVSIGSFVNKNVRGVYDLVPTDTEAVQDE